MATIFIGLGGTGVDVVSRIKNKYDRFEFTKERIGKEVYFHAIDIDEVSMDVYESIDFTQVSVPNPRNVVLRSFEKDKNFRKWWHNRYIPENALVPGKAAGRHRFNGRLLFWENFDKIREALDTAVDTAKKIVQGKTKTGTQAVKIFLVNSLGGGTGAGMFIDVGFLLRDLLGNIENIDVYSFLLNGNIWEKSGFIDAEVIGLGALTELERWMENPSEYNMSYWRNKLPSRIDEFDKLFKMVFFIDYTNQDNRIFASSGTVPLFKKYIDFSSWILFFLSLSEADMEFQNIEGVLGELDKIKKDETKRALRYGSLALSVITVPYEEIFDWIIGTYISEFETGFYKEEINVDEFLNTLKIYEQNGSQLSRSLKETDSFRIIRKFVDDITNEVGDSRSVDEFNLNISSNKLEDLEKLDDKIEDWEKEVNTKLNEKVQDFRKEITNILEECFKKSLNFNEILEFIGSLEIKLEEQKNRVIKQYNTDITPSQVKDIIDNILREIRELPSGAKLLFRRGEFFNAVQDWIGQLKRYYNIKVNEILNKRLTDFYEKDLNNILEFKKRIVNDLKRIYDGFIGSFKRRRDKYHEERASILDVERLKRKEYPLYVNVSVSSDDMKELVKELIENDETSGKMKSLWIGQKIGDKELHGLEFFYRALIDDISENQGRGEEVIIGRGISSLLKYIEVIFKNEIDSKVKDYFRLDRALKKFFSKKYEEFHKVLEYSEQKSKFFEEMKYQVGQDYVNALKKKDLSRKKWVDTATEGFIKNIASFVNPFWLISDPTIREEFVVPRLKGEKSKIYINQNLDLPIPKDLKSVELPSDEFRAFFISYDLGAPLYVLNAVNNIYEKLYEGRAGFMPFSDERFLNEWKDNIEEPSPFELIGFDFIMALGFGIITRKKDSYFYRDIKLGSITKAIKKIKDEYASDINKELKEKVLDYIFDTSLSEIEKVERYNGILSNADELLSKMEPPKTRSGREAYDIWRKLKEKVKKGEGEYYRDNFERMAELIYEQLGIKV